MKQRLINTALAISLFVSSLGLAVALPQGDALASPISEARKGAQSSGGGGPTVPELIETITNILLFVVGAAAVIMIVVGGIQYVASAGDESKAKTAKNTILYSVIGLIVAFAAYAIINFILNQF